MKKALSILLALVMLAGLAVPTFADGGFQLFSNELTEAEALIVAALEAGEAEADLSALHLSDPYEGRDLYYFFSAVLCDHPELITVNLWLGTTLNGNSEVQKFRFSYHDDMTPEIVAACKGLVAEFAAQVNAMELNDFDKVLFAHNFIKERLDIAVPNIPVYTNAYGELMTDTYSLYARAKALSWALKEVGLEAYYADAEDPDPSDSYEPCPFVFVRIGGKGYYIDSTMMSPNQSNSHMILVSEETFRTKRHDMTGTNAIYACGWKNISGLCTDKTYESAWWNLAGTKELGYLDGWWYFTDGIDLYRGKTSAPGSREKLTNHTEKTYRWQYSNFRLFDIVTGGGCVYFSSPKSIIRFDPASREETTLYTLTAAEQEKGQIYDLVLDGNYIEYHIANDRGAADRPNQFTATGRVQYKCDTHNFGAWTTADPGTCVAHATEKRVCSVCRFTETRETDAYGNHVFGSWTETTPPTSCQPSGAGEETRVCTLCGTPETRPKTGDHRFGEWTVTKEPTCGEAGEKTRSCIYDGCDKTQTEPIPATGNHVDTDGNGSCDGCGANLNQKKSFIDRIKDFFARIRQFFMRLFGRA